MADPTEHTLYCIGGSLDGQVRTERKGFLTNSLPGGRDWYSARYFYGKRPLVCFWVVVGCTNATFQKRANELHTAAAVLADEQQIHT